MMRNVFLLIASALVASTVQVNALESSNARAAFARLGTLVGTWSGHNGQGKAHTVSFRRTAADSVLVETWTLESGRESMTMYALDGERLLATHYCPQGNQPRLVFGGVDAQHRLQFRFVDGSNLHVQGASHQQAFWIRFDDDGGFERAETYVENDAAEPATEEGAVVHYTRVD